MQHLATMALLLAIAAYPASAWGAVKGWSSIFKIGQAAKATNALSKGGSPLSVGDTANYSKSYDQNTLRPEQLQSGLLVEREIANSQGSLELGQERIRSDIANIARIRLDITQSQFEFKSRQVGSQDSGASVDQHNREVDIYNNRARAYKEELAKAKSFESEYNAGIDAHNNAAARFQRSCAGKGYYDDDLRGALSIIK